MRKRILSLMLTVLTIVGAVPTASAAPTLEEAMAEVSIFARNDDLDWLTMNGSVKTQHYTYYNYTSVQTGQTKDIPAYCVDPRLYGVPALVDEGTAIKYSAESTVSDPKVCGIIANGYPHMDLATLGVNSVDEAYYATKTALWCYLLSNWSISSLDINPSLSGAERAAAERVLTATKAIYNRGMQWDELVSPKLTAKADKDTAYPVTINGEEYYQQVITITSETWPIETVKLNLANGAPEGAKILSMDNEEIDRLVITTSGADGFEGQCKIVFPADSVTESGTAQLNMNSVVVQYAIYYARCLETDEYGNVQDYMLDSDPHIPIASSFIARFAPTGTPTEPDEPDTPDEPGTGLKIVKMEAGTEIPLEGAVFTVTDPDGVVIGSYSTGADGTVQIPVDVTGHYTVEEVTAPKWHLLAEDSTQHVNVEHGKVAVVTFTNESYGNLRVEKISDTGEGLKDVTIQIKHIESGATQTGKTGADGVIEFQQLKPGAYEVKELAGIEGWLADTDTIQTVTVVSGDTSTVTMTNKELPGLRILKYDRTTLKVMADIDFEVWYDGVSLGQFTTDQTGEILLLNAKPGTYLVKEVQTDDEHIVDTTPQQIELKAGDEIKKLVFFNDRLPGIHLIKVDSNDLSKPIANAKFRIEAVDGSWGPEELTTAEDGTIDLSRLPAKAFVVTELSCPGYVIDDGQRIIQLDGNEQAQFVFTNSKLPSLYLMKTSADGTALPGVSFRLSKIEDGSRYLDRTTNAAGEILWKGLEPGVYSLKEISTDETHILDSKEYHVELFPGKRTEVCLSNDKRPNLTIWKFDADDGVTPVEGATFLVEYADGHSIAEVTTGPDGSATVENLLPSVVKITEKSVPSPYLLDAEPQLATLYPNRDRDVYFFNHKAPTIKIVKQDSITEERLESVKFRVWYASNKTSSGEYRDLGVFVTDENGEITLSRAEHGLEDGWFRVQELEPKTGYAIKGDGTQEAFVQAGKSKTFLFENTPLSALVIWKHDNKTSAPVSATFQIRYLGGTSGSGGTVIDTVTTSSVTGSATITGLKAGTYIIEEIAVNNDGYVVNSAPQTVYISGKEQDVIPVYFGNSPRGALLITKKSDSGEPLSGVEFTVTDSTGSLIGDANGKFWTSGAGTILIEGINPGTTLIATETKGKDGYVMDDVPQTAVIHAGQTVTLEFINAKKGNLIVQKYGLRNGEKIPLEGVEFKITYADGKVVDTENGKLSSNGIYFSNSEGQVVLSDIVGTVVVTEVSSVSGFTIDPNTRTQTVVINPGDDTQTLYFYNNGIGGVEIIKVDAAKASKRIPGVSFEIRRAGDDALVDTVITDSNGRAFLSLEDGVYYAVEISAAEGYLLDDTHHTFEVKDRKTTTLQVKNAATCGILIHKISSATGKGIPGVAFLLYDRGKNPIGEYVSDQWGYVHIDDLPGAGRYYLRELENEGYLLDNDLKTVYVKAGETTEVTWENTPITGQIQITKTSADYNTVNGWPAGTALPGAVFEIYDKANNLVDTVETNQNGIAISQPLPLGRYKVIEVKTAEFYGLDPTPVEVELEFSGQLVKLALTNKSLYTNVSITKRGYVEVMPGQTIRYGFSGIGNNSTTSLTSFYWRDVLPTQTVRLDKIVTGTYNVQGSYKIVYKTNLSSEYRTLADNLSTMRSYVVNASPAVLGLAANECVTEFMVVFGVVPSNFRQVEAPQVYCTVNPNLVGGTQFTNQADVGGVYNGQWIMAADRWVTRVYKPSAPLPRTGY